MAKKILFVCSTGIATSTMVAEKVLDYLKKKGVDDIAYNQTNVASVQSNLSGVDLVISTTNIPYEIDTKVIRGLAFLTGIGEDKVLEEIYDELTK